MRARSLLGVGAALVALAPAAAGACATAPPPGVVVPIADEEALIVWDAATHTEHFVRRATFAGAPRDFGFLVPTPARPELAEVPEALFRGLTEETRPPVVVESRLRGVELSSLCFLSVERSVAMKSAVEASPVTVLARTQVGGYDAVVLEAREAGALAAWLRQHGYDDRPSLREWLAPYVAADWKLTAFRVTPAGAGPVATSPVRLTFHTERPFFPYREPAAGAESAGKDRLLRVYFLGDQRVDGQLGGKAWPGQVELARRVEPGWLGALPGGEGLGQPRYLTLFEDRSSPRPAVDEVFFAPSPAGDLERAPVVVAEPWKLPIPVELLALGLLVGLIVRARRAR